MKQPELSRLTEFIEAALHEAGWCRRVREITKLVNRIAAHSRGRPYGNREVAEALVSDQRFRWTGKGSYGLARWNVGLSEPPREPGVRHTITMEIDHLMDERDTMPMQSMLEHFARRFTVLPVSVHHAVVKHPNLEIKDGNVVKRTERASSRKEQRYPVDANTIRQIRQAAGMTQQRLAAAAGTSTSNISMYESGLRKPSTKQLLKLAQALGTAPEELLTKPAA